MSASSLYGCGWRFAIGNGSQMKVRSLVLAALVAVAACSQPEPARDAGVNRIFANVSGIT